MHCIMLKPLALFGTLLSATFAIPLEWNDQVTSSPFGTPSNASFDYVRFLQPNTHIPSSK